MCVCVSFPLRRIAFSAGQILSPFGLNAELSDKVHYQLTHTLIEKPTVVEFYIEPLRLPQEHQAQRGQSPRLVHFYKHALYTFIAGVEKLKRVPQGFFQ